MSVDFHATAATREASPVTRARTLKSKLAPLNVTTVSAASSASSISTAVATVISHPYPE
jgi:hypothetical protein